MKFAPACWLLLAACAQAGGLEFETMLNEIHAPADAKIVTADFKFTNKGDKASTIVKSDPGCSCVSVEVTGGKFRYAPGESGVVRATFDMGNFSGTVDKGVALWIDNDPQDKPSKTLTVRVFIPVLVEIEPKTLKWDLDGKASPQTLHIRMTGDKPIHVLKVTSTSTAFISELKTVEKGSKYEVIVTPLSVKEPSLGVMRIETDCPISKHKIQQAFAVVRKPTVSETAAKP